MAENIKFTDLSVQNLFKNFYAIPAYQREYVWSEKEVVQLLVDLFDEYDRSSASEYFLGSLVVCREKQSVKFEVIDGQQRLITLSLVLNVFKIFYKKINENTNSIDKLLFSEAITENGETISSRIIEVMYEGKDAFDDLLRNGDVGNSALIEGFPGLTILEAHKTIVGFFNENFDSNKENSIETLKRFLGYILNKVKLIQIETPEISNALKIFETINERGVGLDQVDLLKNLLFIQVPRNDFHKLEKEWDKFRKIIQGEKYKEKPLRFLRYFIIANYETKAPSVDDAILREDAIYDWFKSNESQCNYKSNSFAFVRKIHENADFYMNLIKSRYSDENCEQLVNIDSLVGASFKQHYILLLSAQHMEKSLFIHFLEQLETLLFYYNITKEPARDIERKFVGWATEIKNIKISTQLNNFISARFEQEILDREKSFKLNFLDLSLNKMQKSRMKYILGKISQYVDNQWIGEDSFKLEMYLKKSIHIEHILPDNPTDELLNDFSQGNKEKYNEYKNKIGNLTLLEKPINISAQRDFYNRKKAFYEECKITVTKSLVSLNNVGKVTSINRVNKKLKIYEKWDASSIEDRSELLYELSKDIWCISRLDK